jgi:hypothetical protein
MLSRLAVGADGRIVATCSTGNTLGEGVARFTSDGALDTTFARDGTRSTTAANQAVCSQ